MMRAGAGEKDAHMVSMVLGILFIAFLLCGIAALIAFLMGRKEALPILLACIVADLFVSAWQWLISFMNLKF